MPGTSPMLEQHRAANARLVHTPGGPAVESFGDVRAEYDAVSESAALLDRSHRGRVLASGADALDLINRFSTNETVEMSDGEVVVTVLTTDIGRVMEVVTVVRHSGDETLILTDPGAEGRVIEWLDRYNFGEDCEFEIVTASTAQFTLAGPGARDLAFELPEPGSAGAVTLGESALEVVAPDGPTAGTFELILSAPDQAPAAWDAAISAGAVPAGEAAFELWRVENGLPVSGRELSDRVNPLEAGLQSYVSFSKGCYMGQEVIARLDTYDKLQRRLVGLTSDVLLAEGGSLRAGERDVGRVTTAIDSPRLGRPIALAYVRKGHSEPGTRLDTDAGPVQVVELPFVKAPAPA